MAVVSQYDVTPGLLHASLQPVARRLRYMRSIRMASLGAFIGTCASIVAALLDFCGLLPDWITLPVFIPLAIGLGALVGAFIASRRPMPLMAAARLTETRLGLKERLSSALEFEQYSRNPRDPIPSLLVRMQQRDAVEYAGAVRPRDAVPFRMPWELKAFLISLVVLVLALFVPSLPMFTPLAEQIERGIVAREGAKLQQAARMIEHQAEVQQLPHTQWAAQQMRRLGQQMAHGRMDKRQAFVRYSRLTQQMQQIQQRLQAQAGNGSKSLANAGAQLANTLSGNGREGGQPSSQPQTKPGAAQGAGGKGTGKGAGQNAQAKNASHGFNIPNLSNNPSGHPGGSQSTQSSTPEARQIAQALQHGDTATLSQQLRQLARRVESGSMPAGEQAQAQEDLQKLSDALKGTKLKETQQHSQNAANALQKGDRSTAASEMRKAADAAERETHDQQDQSAMQDAQQSLQNSRNDMAGASKPSDIGRPGQSGSRSQQGSGQGQPGQGQGQSSSQGGSSQGGSGGGQGDSSGDSSDNSGNGSGDSAERQAEREMQRQGQGAGQGSGTGQSDQPGTEGGGGGSANRAGHGFGHGSKGGSKKWAKFQGTPQKLNPNFDPSQFPKYNKIYLGKPGSGKAAGRLGDLRKVRPAAGPHGAVGSSVPYYQYAGQARQQAEHAVDNEDIPPAYKKGISQYFNSLNPSPK
ncbi:MAG: hypothetical protein ACLQVD_16835 [Capsulimonadaceae bacterium]